jgi:twitching motility protein PilT
MSGGDEMTKGGGLGNTSSIQIDRILDTCIRQGASDIHCSIGRPPTLRLNGRLRNLATKVLEPDDTVALMKSITPEKNQQELQEQGSTDFGFAFGDQARFRVSVFRQRGALSLVLRQIPNRLLTFEQIGLPPLVQDLLRVACSSSRGPPAPGRRPRWPR